MVAQYPAPTPQRDPSQMVQKQPVGMLTPIAEPTLSGAQPATGGLSPLLNQVMGTPGQMATTKPILGETRPPRAGEMPIAPTATTATQPTIAPMGAQTTQPAQGLVSGPSPLSSVGAGFAPQQPVAAPTVTTTQAPSATTTAAQPPLIGQEYWTQALEATRGATPFESQYKLPTQEELNQFANTQYQQQLADLSGDVQRRQGQQAESLEQQLANRGIPVGSEAYARAKYDLAQQQASENAQLRAQARQFGEQSAQARYDRILNAYRTQMQESQLRTEQAYAGVQALGGLAGTQFQAGEQRSLQERQLASTESLAQQQIASEERRLGRQLTSEEQRQQRQLASTEVLTREGIASEERRLGRQLTAQEQLQQRQIASTETIARESIAAEEARLGRQLTFEEQRQQRQIASTETLAREQIRSEEERLGRQLNFQERQDAKRIASTETLAREQIASEEARLGRQLTSQEQQQAREIASREYLDKVNREAQTLNLDKQLENNRWLAGFDRATQVELLQQQQKGALDLATFDAQTKERLLNTEIASNERLQGLSSQLQRDLATMEIEGRFDLQRLTGEQQNELLNKEIQGNKDLAAFNRDTQLAIVEREAINRQKAAEFEAATQKQLLTMNLDQQDKQFIASMDMENKRLAQDSFQFLQQLNLNKNQFDQTYQLQLRAQANSEKQWQKEFTQKIAQDKFLNGLQKQQLAELIRSNKADEAIKKFAAQRAGAGGRLTPDEEFNLQQSRSSGYLKGQEQAIINSGMSQKDKDRAIRNLYSAGGSGGIARTI